MAHAGTSADLAKQGASASTGQWFGRVLIALAVVVAIALATVVATSYIAGSKAAVGVSSAPDRTDDLMQARPGAAPAAPADPTRLDHLRGNTRGSNPSVDQFKGRGSTMTLSGTSALPKIDNEPAGHGNLP